MLRLHLPRNVTVEGDAMRLGHICVIRCDEQRLQGQYIAPEGPAELAQKAAAVAMGRSPWQKEKIVIDRQTILARLASSGIRVPVAFTGAEQVVIQRNFKVYSGAELTQAAQEHLAKVRPAPAEGKWVPVGNVEDLLAPQSRDIRLQVDLPAGLAGSTGVSPVSSPSPATGETPVLPIRLTVSLVSADKTVASHELLFRLAFAVRQAVTTREIPAGGIITPENTTIQTIAAPARPAGPWSPPFGLLAAQRLPAGTVIRDSHAKAPQPGLAVKRDQTVIMRLLGDGFALSAVGKALQDGKVGDVIKVENTDTRRTVAARVAGDGSVQPLFAEHESRK